MKTIPFVISATRKFGNCGSVLISDFLPGTLKVGDELKLQIDETRRVAVMQNHTGTHVLNYALRKVLSADADQRGSLVAPERMRFDFASNRPMTAQEVKKAEEAAVELVSRNGPVFAKESSLSQAKAVKVSSRRSLVFFHSTDSLFLCDTNVCLGETLELNFACYFKGLRAVFNETYPDPVRVVSIGVSVEDLLANPDRGDALNTSVEFCGGTHLQNAGHIGENFSFSRTEVISRILGTES